MSNTREFVCRVYPEILKRDENKVKTKEKQREITSDRHWSLRSEGGSRSIWPGPTLMQVGPDVLGNSI